MMKKIINALLLLGLMSVSGQSLALRCGNRLIDKNDPKPKVQAICGEPAYKEMREVAYPSYCGDGGYYSDDGYSYDRRRYGSYNYNSRRYRSNYVPCRYRTIDVWVYNFGPRKFMVELVFRRGVVKEINTLEYGY